MSVVVDWTQTITSIIYLLVVWTLAVAAFVHSRRLDAARRRIAVWVLLGLFILAFGDSFHVIPLAYRTFAGIATDATPSALAQWIGFGLFFSSFTLSFFYLFLQVYCWRKFDLTWDAGMWFLTACFVVRVGLLFFPQNNWAGEPSLWKFYRNIPFTIQGAGVAWLLLRHAGGQPAHIGRWLRVAAWAIVASFACYIATVVGTWWHPIWGAFMLPKMIAYIVAVWAFYQAEFQTRAYGALHAKVLPE